MVVLEDGEGVPTELAEAVAGFACVVLYDSCDVSVFGYDCLLGGVVFKSLVSRCGEGVVKCEQPVRPCSLVVLC